MAVTPSSEEDVNMDEEIFRLFGFKEEARFLFQRHIYEGCNFTSFSPPECLRAVKKWETREEDIFIVTFPKSGTHWMWEIVLLILARGNPKRIDRFKLTAAAFEMLYPPEFKVSTHELIAKMESPRVIATHLPWQLLPVQLTEQKRGKIVYVTRNPKDILASKIRYSLDSSGKQEDTRIWKYSINSFLRGENTYCDMYCSWFDHVESYWKNRENGNVYFTSYEEIRKDFQSVVTPLSEFILGEELDDETRASVEKHSSLEGMKESYDQIEKSRPDGIMMTRAMGKNSYIQKGVVGSWKNLFTVAESEMFDKACKEKMANCGFKIDYTQTENQYAS